MQRRFQPDDYLHEHGGPEFGRRFLVVCPSCQKQATVTPKTRTASNHMRPWRLTCTHCGHSKDAPALKSWTGQLLVSPYDWYFHEPLWLQTPCCGRVLWAHNERHLNYMEHYVAASLRNEAHVVTRQRGNVPVTVISSALAAKFPAWLISAKNRDEVLRGIAKLKLRLWEAGR